MPTSSHIAQLHQQIAALDIDQHEKDLMIALVDPVTWAEATLKDPSNPRKNLSFADRPYQCEMLRCLPEWYVDKNGERKQRYRIKQYRLGRRVGKTLALAVEALHVAVTNYNYKILYISPFETQCSIFFNMLQALLTDTVIKPSRFTFKPFKLAFENGSLITAHTANVKSTIKGSTIRGAEGDLIILDESDFGLDQVINDVVMPIYLNNPRSRIIVASTPSGRRGTFWKWSVEKDSLGIAEFHYSSRVSPNWTKEAEEFARATMPSDTFVREILAEFGDAYEGIFRHSDLDAIQENYTYSDHRLEGYRYIMGVDWNEQFGVCIVIVGQNIQTKKYKVVYHEVVEKQKFTQLESVERIIELHKKWRCDFIYVDEGYGHVQVELLMKYGMENPLTNLAKIVKPINYRSNISILNPETQTKEEKPAKAFMVNNLVNIVETRQIAIPESEDHEYGIIGQMRGFQVKKISMTGVPIYEGKKDGRDNDHSLNALMLAMLGFFIEFSDMSGKQTSTGVHTRTISKSVFLSHVDNRESALSSSNNLLASSQSTPYPLVENMRPANKLFGKQMHNRTGILLKKLNLIRRETF